MNTYPFRSDVNTSQFHVHILGCGSARPSMRHAPTAQSLVYRGRIMLIDCGEGTQVQLERAGLSLMKITDIFISHLHGDHVMGLPGLLSSMNLAGRTEPVRVHLSPQGIALIKGVMEVICPGMDPRMIDYRPVDPTRQGRIFETVHLTVETVPLEHRVPACGFIFREKPKAHPMAPAPLSYAFCSDTAYSAAVAEAVKGVDVLYHEATYGTEDQHLAAPRGHSTAAEAGMVGRQAGAGALVIGHYSLRIKDIEGLAAEAAETFGRPVMAAEEGMIIDIKHCIND